MTMRKHLGVAAFLAATTISTNALVGGTEVSQGSFETQWPFAASIDVVIDGEPMLLCTASLISAEWVLTSGHCTAFITSQAQFLAGYEGTQIRVGHRDRTLATIVGATDIITHPSYTEGLPGFDVGLIRLAHPVSDTPAVLAPATPTAGSAATFAGWGSTEGFITPDLLQSATVNIVSLNASSLLAQGESSLCEGDSGGPLLNASHQVIGVASFSADQDCSPGAIGGYARVRVLFPFLDALGIPYNEHLDTVPPVFQPRDRVEVESEISPVLVPYPLPIAIDAVDGPVPVQCLPLPWIVPPPGTVFQYGTTEIFCGATDAAGNTKVMSFDLQVYSASSPGAITNPGNSTKPVASAAAGQALRLWASGFAPNQDVSLMFVTSGGEILEMGQARADLNSVVDLRFSVPRGAPRGASEVVVSGRAGGGEEYMRIFALNLIGGPGQ